MTVRTTILSEHVALVTIDRPDARNAVNGDVALALEQAVHDTERDDDIWTIILTGAGGQVFSAGADLKEVSAGRMESLFTENGGFAGFVTAQRTKPWIAAVEGFALAGGCEIALACDLIVASENAQFGLPEVSLGLVAAGGGLYRLPRRLPYSVALELTLTASRLSAQRAHDLGLVNRIAKQGCAVGDASLFAEEIVANAPLAIRESLAIVRNAAGLSDPVLQDQSVAAQERLSNTEDFAEGPRAFIEKRPPVWRGS